MRSTRHRPFAHRPFLRRPFLRGPSSGGGFAAEARLRADCRSELAIIAEHRHTEALGSTVAFD